MLLIKYVLKALFFSALIGGVIVLVAGSRMQSPVHSDSYFRTKVGLAVGLSLFFFVMMLVTFPVICFFQIRKNPKQKLTTQIIFDAQFNFFQNTNDYFRRHTTLIFCIVFGLAASYAIYDTIF